MVLLAALSDRFIFAVFLFKKRISRRGGEKKF